MRAGRKGVGRLAAVVAVATLAAVLLLSIGNQPGSLFSGRLLARSTVNDLGFRPDPDGFGFENYGEADDVRNLDIEMMRALFGDEACTIRSGGRLVLTPPARRWMEEINGLMDNGHCEGMAALSLLFFTGEESITDYGAQSVFELSLDNGDLQARIARWFATQVLDPTASSVIVASPSEIVSILMEQMASGDDTYTMGVYKEDGSDGHAITPFAVDDEGEGRYRILVYDNNFPGETGIVEVDADNETWSYQSSINPEYEPEWYEGSEETMTLELTPTSARLELHEAPFAKTGEGQAFASLAGVRPGGAFNQLFLDGGCRMLIMDEEERMLGEHGGEFLNEIPGARYTRIKAGPGYAGGQEPVFWLPGDLSFAAAIEGTASGSPAEMTIIGPGFATAVEGISLPPGEVDFIYFDPLEKGISYETDRTESPNLVLGIDVSDELCYFFEIRGARMQGGGTITALLDADDRDIVINTGKLENEGTFDLVMTRIDSESEVELLAEDVRMPAGALIYMNYGDWKSTSNVVQFGVDLDGDGEIDEVYEAYGVATEKAPGGRFATWMVVSASVVLLALVVIFLIRRRRIRKLVGGD